ncbi:MAG TPA: alpha/beta fold hydrolase [Urbifossiella sp.]|jgi:dienelactone hydrolase
MPLDRYEEEDYDRPARRPRASGSGKKWLLVLGILGALGFCCCGGLVGLGWQLVKPTSFPEQTQDYADARKQFKTKLTVREKAPQVFDVDKLRDGVTEIEYKSKELKLKAWIGGPKGGGIRPAVLFLHGGFALDNADWDQTQPFRDAGFITMLPMLRGENGMDGNFTMFYDEVDDAIAAADELARQPGVDPNRICIAGHSAGGTIAMLAAMTSKQFRACASFSGSPDQVSFVRTNDGLAPFDTEDQKELIMRSPLAFPKSFKCPTRLYYGDAEFLLMFSMPKLAEKAKAAGCDVEAIKVPGDHFNAVIPAIRESIYFLQAELRHQSREDQSDCWLRHRDEQYSCRNDRRILPSFTVVLGTLFQNDSSCASPGTDKGETRMSRGCHG